MCIVALVLPIRRVFWDSYECIKIPTKLQFMENQSFMPEFLKITTSFNALFNEKAVEWAMFGLYYLFH